MGKDKPQTVVLGIESDEHCGGTTSVAPPEGVRRDDGDKWLPSKAQVWLWEERLAFWAKVQETVRDHNAKLWVVLNGDCIEGDHHDTPAIISRNLDAQDYVADRVFGVVRDTKPSRLFVVRGTEAHVGSAGSGEESLAKRLGAERDPETQNWSRWRLRLNVNGLLCDFQHHASIGGLPWTHPAAMARLAFRIWSEHTLRGIRSPDLAFRSHVHRFGDSFGAYPTRAIVTPSWQLKTAHAHKVVPESIADVGGVIVVVAPDGKYEVQPYLATPALPAVA